MRTRLQRTLVLVVSLMVGVAMVAVASSDSSAGSSSGTATSERQGPVYGGLPVYSRNFPDPSVQKFAGGYVGVATGGSVPRAIAPDAGGPWSQITPALASLPSWALSNRIWAADLTSIDGVWLLYFSAEAAGLGNEGRCIGVATAASPDQPFVPDDRPVVCPRRTGLGAYDEVVGRPRVIQGGVIDPEVFHDKRHGKQFLMYRTQGTPASIRMVRLPKSGRPGTGTRESIELVRSAGVIENPLMLQKRGKYILFTSEGNFGLCGYTTTWRRTNNLRNWSDAKGKILMDQASTGLCGPGGADFLTVGGQDLLYFHAWSCPDLGTNCPGSNNYDTHNLYHARRALFGVQITWTARQSPKLAAYIAPIAPPPTQSPSPSPTPSLSSSPSTSPPTGPPSGPPSGAAQDGPAFAAPSGQSPH